jgi:hypothetical protein
MQPRPITWRLASAIEVGDFLYLDGSGYPHPVAVEVTEKRSPGYGTGGIVLTTVDGHETEVDADDLLMIRL